jgi:hypothetical protein
LDQVISVFVIALKSEELTDCVETVHMFWVELGELKESIDVVGVADDLVLALKGVISLGGLELYGSIVALDLELLADLEELSNSR